ncbi:DUF4190 domain-containing protein [Kutzneria sp. CA-103260]|uniref:DUF4190 domain-containing protein n=1 Tax=Kutzneria sp. CA-103260 TaxID=2802641 RepID=UPI001BA9635A|nr:DUF4190 domain-containing protein [Kutzneria sp. CA-103260]QUQ69601.1 hypothetical protein JJ691_73600 [Kutzneria sp. CA-103260]
MSTEHEPPSYENYPAMPPAQASPGNGQAGPWGGQPGPWPGQPGPWPGQPGPWGNQQWPGPQPGTSGFAIASFVLSLLGLFPLCAILGLTFGIVSLAEVRRSGRGGKGLAIAGVVLSGLWLAAWLTFFVAAVVIGVHEASTNSSSGVTASYNLKPGQCFDRATTSQGASVTVKDCVQPHDAEVFAVEPVQGSTYPGSDAVMLIGESRCPGDSDRFLTSGLNYPDIDVHYLYPQPTSWARGDRSVECFYRSVTGAKMTGHAKDTGRPYTEDQKRYLAAVDPYDKIVDDEQNADEWTAERDAVVRSIPVLQQEIDALKAGPWPANIQPEFDQLVAAKQQELTDRQHAAAATDEDTFDEAMDAGDSHDGSDRDRAIRVSLGLHPR